MASPRVPGKIADCMDALWTAPSSKTSKNVNIESKVTQDQPKLHRTAPGRCHGCWGQGQSASVSYASSQHLLTRQAKSYVANVKASPALLQNDYCGPVIMETNTKGTKNSLASPAKPPAPQKKQKGEDNTPAGPNAGAASNNAILNAIGSLIMHDGRL